MVASSMPLPSHVVHQRETERHRPCLLRNGAPGLNGMVERISSASMPLPLKRMAPNLNSGPSADLNLNDDSEIVLGWFGFDLREAYCGITLGRIERLDGAIQNQLQPRIGKRNTDRDLIDGAQDGAGVYRLIAGDDYLRDVRSRRFGREENRELLRIIVRNDRMNFEIGVGLT